MKSLFFKAILTLTLITPVLVAQEIDLAGRPRRTIVVTGTGDVSAAPDQAIVRLGATVQDSQADVAQAKVNDILQTALSAIEKVGVPKKSIKTARLTLSPVYAQVRPDPSGEQREPRITGYRANNTLEVTLDEMSNVGKVIDAGIKSGANELQGVTFGLKNDLPQRTDALTRAAQEARTKADVIARALDLQLGSVVEVTEGGVHILPQQEYFGGARMAMAAAQHTPVEPGEVKVQASVTVHYQIGAARR